MPNPILNFPNWNVLSELPGEMVLDSLKQVLPGMLTSNKCTCQNIYLNIL